MAKGYKTGGRQKGSRNKSTIERERLMEKVADAKIGDGVTPLEVMLDNMRFAHAQAAELTAKLLDVTQIVADDMKQLVKMRALAQTFAADAAPYLHPRLAAVEHTGNMTVAVTQEQMIAELETATETFMTALEAEDIEQSPNGFTH